MKKLHSSMGQSIIDHLSNLGTIPEKGYLAGQSVSSALFDLHSDNNIGMVVYNDLDIFYDATNEDRDLVRRSTRKLGTVTYEDCDIKQDYDHLRFEITNSYEIVRSYREDFVNKVAVDSLYAVFRKTRLETLLSGFDLNCTQVGVDLANRTLEWTDDFATFWENRQLLISNVQTPHHTALRWAKKRSELPGCYGKDDDAMELVSLLNHSKGVVGNQERSESHKIKWRFGKKNAGMYKEYEKSLESYFDLVHEDSGFYFLDPIQSPDKILVDQAKKYPTRALAKMFNEERRSRKKSQAAKIHAILAPGMSKYSFVEITLGSFWVQGDKYLKGNVDIKNLNKTNELLMHRPLLLESLWGLSSVEHIEFTKEWNGLERVYGRWVYGYIESLFFRHIQKSFTISELKNLISEEHVLFVDLDKPLHNNKRIKYSIDDFEFNELVTRQELLDEGEFQNHCVGGYAQWVHSGDVRIIQCRNNDRKKNSTIELRKYKNSINDFEWKVIQHRGYNNEIPEVETREVLDKFLHRLQYSNESTNINSYDDLYSSDKINEISEVIENPNEKKKSEELENVYLSREQKIQYSNDGKKPVDELKSNSIIKWILKLIGITASSRT